MCFNSEVSLATYFIGLTGSYSLYKIDKIPEALFFGWVVQMQLVDFFLWQNSDRLEERKKKEDKEIKKCESVVLCNSDKIDKCNKTNKVVSKVGLFINHMEPFVLWGSILKFSKKRLPFIVNLMMIIFLILTLIYSMNVISDEEASCTMETEESSPHLHWKWNYGKNHRQYYTIFGLIIMMLSVFGLEDGFVLAFVSSISFAISNEVYKETHSVGNMWCFVAAFCPWLLTGIYSKIK